MRCSNSLHIERSAQYAVGQRLGCDEDATFLGFGAQYNATDQRGEAFDLFVEEQGIGRTGGLPLMGNAHSTYFPVPYWLDARGFGVALETEARVSVDVCADDMEVMRVEVHSAQPADLVLLQLIGIMNHRHEVFE